MKASRGMHAGHSDFPTASQTKADVPQQIPLCWASHSSAWSFTNMLDVDSTYMKMGNGMFTSVVKSLCRMDVRLRAALEAPQPQTNPSSRVLSMGLSL